MWLCFILASHHHRMSLILYTMSIFYYEFEMINCFLILLSATLQGMMQRNSKCLFFIYFLLLAQLMLKCAFARECPAGGDNFTTYHGIKYCCAKPNGELNLEEKMSCQLKILLNKKRNWLHRI